MCSGQGLVPFYHIHQMRAMNIVVLQFTPISPEAGFGIVFFSKIEIRTKSIVKEYSIGCTLVHPTIKRNGPVQRILVPAKRISIGIPVLEMTSPQVHIP